MKKNVRAVGGVLLIVVLMGLAFVAVMNKSRESERSAAAAGMVSAEHCLLGIFCAGVSRSTSNVESTFTLPQTSPLSDQGKLQGGGSGSGSGGTSAGTAAKTSVTNPTPNTRPTVFGIAVTRAEDKPRLDQLAKAYAKCKATAGCAGFVLDGKGGVTYQ